MNLVENLFNIFKFFSFDISEYEYKKFNQTILPKINEEYDKIRNLSIENIKDIMISIREEYNNNKDLDALLPKVFALVKKAMGLTIYKEHFNVQLFGGYVLHTGRIAEMKTGEGKTFISPLAACLNALTQESVIIITSNDYLAKRDAELLKPIYNALGFTVGYIIESMDTHEKIENYKCDIIYTSHNVVVFDYLRDRLVTQKEDKMQPYYNFVIIDEIDNCLIDAARTPLVISGKEEENFAQQYINIANIIKQLKSEHYTIIKASERAILTDEGLTFVENELKKIGIYENIYERNNIGLFNIISNLLHACIILKNGKDYIISKSGKILFIDSSTHRTSESRRFSHGLHTAIEAKEGVELRKDNSISASITYFTYITKFKKVAGMSGTAMQDQNEFINLYNLHIVRVPTNKPSIRNDHNNKIWLFKTKELMFNEVVRILKEKPENQPVLICTPSVYESEMLHDLLTENDIESSLLNAKNAEVEASVIENAGLPGAVTVTTGMAGRGTDILIGGSIDVEMANISKEYDITNMDITELRQKVAEFIQERKQLVLNSGGLLVIIVGLLDSKKTEMQIRGRTGRQGDIGESRAFCSREDTIVELALPKAQESGGNVLDNIAHHINFINDANVLDSDDIQEAMREIQYVYMANNTEVRKHQSQLSSNAQCVSLFENRKNFFYRDYIMEYDNHHHLHEQLVLQYIDSFAKTPINKILEYLTEKVFTNCVNPLLNCQSINEIKQTISMKLDEKYNNNNNNYSEILYIYDQCMEKFMIAEDGIRRTINTIVYGQMDPSAEFEKLMYELLEDTMKTYVKKLLKICFYNSSLKRNCSGSTIESDNEQCDIDNNNDDDDDDNSTIDFDAMFKEWAKTLENINNKPNLAEGILSNINYETNKNIII